MKLTIGAVKTIWLVVGMVIFLSLDWDKSWQLLVQLYFGFYLFGLIIGFLFISWIVDPFFKMLENYSKLPNSGDPSAKNEK